jgi:hypothetical protein
VRTYRRSVFNQHLIIPCQGDKEYNRSDTLEEVYPLSSFRPLTADVNDRDDLFLEGEHGLADAYRPCTGKDDILNVK